MGSPIRKSPDHRLLASPRGLSQLATSFIAYLRQGIHTHALSSLTIKFTLDTELATHWLRSCSTFTSARHTVYCFHGTANLCCPSIFKCQRSVKALNFQQPALGSQSDRKQTVDD